MAKDKLKSFLIVPELQDKIAEINLGDIKAALYAAKDESYKQWVLTHIPTGITVSNYSYGFEGSLSDLLFEIAGKKTSRKGVVKNKPEVGECAGYMKMG